MECTLDYASVPEYLSLLKHLQQWMEHAFYEASSLRVLKLEVLILK